MDQLSKIADKIAQIVESSKDKTVLGVRLGAALKIAFPDFVPAAYQCKNLRQFVRKHVPGVVETGYSGVDILYTKPEKASPTATDESVAPSTPADGRSPAFISLPADPITWKAYSNPSYRLSLIANPSTGEVKAVGEQETPQAPWVAIPKLAPEKHHEIASKFVESLPPASRGPLQNILADHQWYVSFFGTTKRLGISKQWGLFKREHLIRYFTAALHEKGVVAAPSAPKHDLPSARTFQTRRPDTRHQSPLSDETQIRELISRLAYTLPIEELRTIRLPLGSVLDALRH
jgi:hypothetical protein